MGRLTDGKLTVTFWTIVGTSLPSPRRLTVVGVSESPGRLRVMFLTGPGW